MKDIKELILERINFERPETSTEWLFGNLVDILGNVFIILPASDKDKILNDLNVDILYGIFFSLADRYKFNTEDVLTTLTVYFKEDDKEELKKLASDMCKRNKKAFRTFAEKLHNNWENENF